MSEITLTADQHVAYKEFVTFVMDKSRSEMILSGFAGTGKTTLVNKLLDDLPKVMRTAGLLSPDKTTWNIVMTATTNKACEAMRKLIGNDYEVKTIQSALALRVKTDYNTPGRETSLVPTSRDTVLENSLIFVDEASYIDKDLMYYIRKLTQNCKIVYIGDPAQLTPTKEVTSPVFGQGIHEARLTKVVRQADGNPIIDLATMFRNVVNTGQWGAFTPDGFHIQRMDRPTFGLAVEQEFNRGDWHHDDSKVLAWRNKCVVSYNHAIRDMVKGEPTLRVGDHAVCNKYIRTDTCKLATDQNVEITEMYPASEKGVKGFEIVLDGHHEVFMPESLAVRKKALKEFQAKRDISSVKHIEERWIDLRAAYACTVNKSQGSTYDKVFIDLDDISAAKRMPNMLMARMLYVAVSRARHHVYLTGDLV